MSADYIVVRDSSVVQEICALTADHARMSQSEHGDLYTLVQEDDYESQQVEAFLEQALPQPA